MFEPRAFVASFGERFAHAESFRKTGEDVVIAACTADRRHRAVHRDDTSVGTAGTDVVPLERRRRRKHEIGVPCHRRPVRFVHDQRVGPSQRAAQPVQVLVVMERIAAGPIDEADVGIRVVGAVVRERLAGMQQQIGDARHRNEIAHRVAAFRQRRQVQTRGRIADIAHRSITVAEPAAGHADLPEQRCKRQRGPHRLLAVLCTLQRVRNRDERALRCHLARKRAQIVGRYSGVALRPFCGFGYAIVLAEHVCDETICAVTEPFEKRRVVQPLGDERVRQAEHHGHVAERRKRIPARLCFRHDVVSQRRKVRDLHAATTRRIEMLSQMVARVTTRRNERVLQRQPAERHHQIGVPRDDVPRRGAPEHRRGTADQMW